MPLPERCGLVFDLDDTLYDEREFVESGLRAVASYLSERIGGHHYERMIELARQREKRIFQILLRELACEVPPDTLLEVYREHKPRLSLRPGTRRLLSDLAVRGHRLGVITDGRSTTQRNKIKALGLSPLLDGVVISEEIGVEKPSPTGFRQMQQSFAGCQMVYVGDNPTKDFLAPNQLGWLTVCVRALPTNIHAQDFASLPNDYQPAYLIDQLAKS